MFTALVGLNRKLDYLYAALHGQDLNNHKFSSVSYSVRGLDKLGASQRFTKIQVNVKRGKEVHLQKHPHQLQIA